MGHAHQQHIQKGGVPGGLVSPGHLVGEKQDAARYQQSPADEHGVAAEGLHPVLDRQHQKQGQGAHDDEQHHPPGLRGVATVAPVGKQVGEEGEKLHNHLPDVPPVDHAHRQQGGKVEQDIEQLVGLLHAEEVLEQGEVPRAGDGQKFGHALNKAQNCGHEIGQNYVPPKTGRRP